MKKRHKIIPESHLVFIKNGKILLSLRTNTGFNDGMYTFISGHVESGETFSECMIREAKEEANICIHNKDLKIIHISNRIVETERISAFFVCKKYKGKIINNEPQKCIHLKRFPIEKLPENTIPFIKQTIEYIKNNIYYSEYKEV